jgi:hypothetical protein
MATLPYFLNSSFTLLVYDMLPLSCRDRRTKHPGLYLAGALAP